MSGIAITWRPSSVRRPSSVVRHQAVSEQKIVLALSNQKQTFPLVAIVFGGMGRNEETVFMTLYKCSLRSLVPFGSVVLQTLF
jgi:hypothetical protein